MKAGPALVALALAASLLWLCASGPAPAADDAAAVAYPDGFRAWTHVKSTLVAPGNKDYAELGGFHHIYANAQAMVGYRTRDFPEGSTIVFDWLKLQGADGAYTEGERRRLDVMVKDSARFAATGGWGFQRFVGDSRTERAVEPAPQQCFACHQAMKRDGLVLSRYRE